MLRKDAVRIIWTAKLVRFAAKVDVASLSHVIHMSNVHHATFVASLIRYFITLGSITFYEVTCVIN